MVQGRNAKGGAEKWGDTRCKRKFQPGVHREQVLPNRLTADSAHAGHRQAAKLPGSEVVYSTALHCQARRAKDAKNPNCL